MINRFSSIFWLAMVSLAVLIHCKGVTFLEEYNPELQLAEDLEKITEYIEAAGLGIPDTALFGAMYFILDEGSGDSVNFGDLISMELAVYNLDTTLVSSNIQFSPVQDTVFLTTSTNDEPVVFTLTESGWAFGLTSIDRDHINGGRALKRAVSESFIRTRTGSHILIILPSTLAYGPSFNSGFRPNSVLLYQFFILDRE